eukprot:FR743557.1.p3 GENE.FR743557.1~~FR743557.1.p3  ORF type:complete len:116 (+),score=64.47 FR743557.1:844-1191(+)
MSFVPGVPRVRTPWSILYANFQKTLLSALLSVPAPGRPHLGGCLGLGGLGARGFFEKKKKKKKTGRTGGEDQGPKTQGETPNFLKGPPPPRGRPPPFLFPLLLGGVKFGAPWAAK